MDTRDALIKLADLIEKVNQNQYEALTSQIEREKAMLAVIKRLSDRIDLLEHRMGTGDEN